jgi:pimeloyl-ACP methyl ester carboxylesterase
LREDYIMSVTGYRWLLVVSLVAALAAIGLGSVTTLLPPELRAWVEDSSNAPMTLSVQIAGTLGALAAVATLVAWIGLWRFRPWARRLAVIATVVGVLAFPFFAIVQSGWAQLFYDIHATSWGGILALSYWSALGERFVKSRGISGTAALFLIVSSPAPLHGQASPAWKDPSPHRVQHVRVVPRVELEVLDWGGQGATLVFLAGGGNTAHVYDDFARRFVPRFRVLGITRRGFGASSRPATGYDTTTLTRDIIAVLDSLGIERASFAGHSFAGTELTSLGVRYPGRVQRLVYLDSGFDYRKVIDSPEWKAGLLYGAPQPPTPSYDDDTGSAWSWTLWGERLAGPGHPEAEVRATLKFDAGERFVGGTSVDRWLERLTGGAEEMDLTRIGPRVLAVYAVPGSAEVMFPFWQSLDATARARCQKMFQAIESVQARLSREFRERVPDVRAVVIPGGRHYVFLTDPGEVTHAMLEFLMS